MPDEERDEWRSFLQALPLSVYDRWIVQLSRIGRVNGISVESFLADDKRKQAMGPRVQVLEILTTLIERTDDGGLRE